MYGQSQPYGQPPMNQPYYGMPGPAPKAPGSGKGKKIAIICSIVGVLAVTAVLLIVFVFGKGGGGASTKEELAESYVSAMNSRNPSSFEGMIVPSKYRSQLDDYLKRRFGYDLKGMLEQEFSEKMSADFECKYLRMEERKTYDEDKIRSLESEFKTYLDVNIDIEEMVRVRVYFQYKGQRESDEEYSTDWEEESDTITLYKTDGLWYISMF